MGINPLLLTPSPMVKGLVSKGPREVYLPKKLTRTRYPCPNARGNLTKFTLLRLPVDIKFHIRLLIASRRSRVNLGRLTLILSRWSLAKTVLAFNWVNIEGDNIFVFFTPEVNASFGYRTSPIPRGHSYTRSHVTQGRGCGTNPPTIKAIGLRTPNLRSENTSKCYPYSCSLRLG